MDNSGQREGEGLAVGGHPFQCGLCRREVVILSSSSCVKGWKIKRQTRNKYSKHVFFKISCFSIVVAALFFLQ